MSIEVKVAVNMRYVICFLTFSLISPSVWSNIDPSFEPQKEVKAIQVQMMEPQEASQALYKEIASDNDPNHVTLISSTDSTDAARVEQLSTQQQISRNDQAKKRLFFKFPFQRIKNRISRHLTDQYNFYRTDRAAVILLTVLTANSSVSWYVFSPNLSADSATIIVAINTFLYAYLGVNAPNWSQVLRSSKSLLQRSRRFKNLNNKLQDFISILTTNAVYNLGYHGIVQAVLNWDNLERMLSFDIVGLILRNTVITVAASGVWDLVLNEWEEKGRISSKTRKKLSWGRSVIMVTLGNLMAIGVPDTLKGMLAFGAAGLEIYLLETNKEKLKELALRIKNIKNLRPNYRFKKFIRSPFKKVKIDSETETSNGICEMLLE